MRDVDLATRCLWGSQQRERLALTRPHSSSPQRDRDALLPFVGNSRAAARQEAAMPHIAPVILKRRPGFLGTPKRPPP